MASAVAAEYTMLDLFERACHIVTVEDPIEFVHQHKLAVVNQREVGADTRSFARALRSALRQDPDVILVGELRDLEQALARLVQDGEIKVTDALANANDHEQLRRLIAKPASSEKVVAAHR